MLMDLILKLLGYTDYEDKINDWHPYVDCGSKSERTTDDME